MADETIEPVERNNPPGNNVGSIRSRFKKICCVGRVGFLGMHKVHLSFNIVHTRTHTQGRHIWNDEMIFCFVIGCYSMESIYSHHKRSSPDIPPSVTVCGSTTISCGYSSGAFDHIRIVQPVPGVSMMAWYGCTEPSQCISKT